MEFLEQVVETLKGYGRQRILEDYRPDSCIVSAKIAVRVFDHYQVKAKALPCRVLAYNPTFVKAIHDGTAKLDTPVNDQPEGCYAVGSDEHLVVYIAEPPGILDLTLDQLSRPDHGIKVEPSSFRAVPAWSDGKISHAYHTGDGTMVIYQAKPRHNWYQVSPNWRGRDAATVKKIAGDIIRHVSVVI